jgi:hypothetical protein
MHTIYTVTFDLFNIQNIEWFSVPQCFFVILYICYDCYEGMITWLHSRMTQSPAFTQRIWCKTITFCIIPAITDSESACFIPKNITGTETNRGTGKQNLFFAFHLVSASLLYWWHKAHSLNHCTVQYCHVYTALHFFSIWIYWQQAWLTKCCSKAEFLNLYHVSQKFYNFKMSATSTTWGICPSFRVNLSHYISFMSAANISDQQTWNLYVYLHVFWSYATQVRFLYGVTTKLQIHYKVKRCY